MCTQWRSDWRISLQQNLRRPGAPLPTLAASHHTTRLWQHPAALLEALTSATRTLGRQRPPLSRSLHAFCCRPRRGHSPHPGFLPGAAPRVSGTHTGVPTSSASAAADAVRAPTLAMRGTTTAPAAPAAITCQECQRKSVPSVVATHRRGISASPAGNMQSKTQR